MMKYTKYLLLIALIATPCILKAPPRAEMNDQQEMKNRFGQTIGSGPTMLWRKVNARFKVAVKPKLNGRNVTYRNDRNDLINDRKENVTRGKVIQYIYDIMYILKRGDERVSGKRRTYRATRGTPAGYGYIIDPKTHGQASLDDSGAGITTTPLRDFLRKATGFGFTKTNVQTRPMWNAIQQLLMICKAKKLEDMFTIAGAINKDIQSEIRGWYANYGLISATQAGMVAFRFKNPRLARLAITIPSSFNPRGIKKRRAFDDTKFDTDYTEEALKDLEDKLTRGNLMKSIATVIQLLKTNGIDLNTGVDYSNFFQKADKIIGEANLRITSNESMAMKEALGRAVRNAIEPNDQGGTGPIKLHEAYESDIASRDITGLQKAATKHGAYDLCAQYHVTIWGKVTRQGNIYVNRTYGGHLFDVDAQGEFKDSLVKQHPNNMSEGYLQKRTDGLNSRNVGRRAMEVAHLARIPGVMDGRGATKAQRNTDDFVEFFEEAVEVAKTAQAKTLVKNAFKKSGNVYADAKRGEKKKFVEVAKKLGLSVQVVIR